MPKKSAPKTATPSDERNTLEQPKSSSKKGGNETATLLDKKDTVEQPKSASKPSKAGNEIDEIFAGKKRKKVEEHKTNKLHENGEQKSKSTKKNKKKKIDKEDKEGRYTDQPAKPRKKTEDGLTIYTEEELGFNKADAGGTPLCPFDCECCF